MKYIQVEKLSLSSDKMLKDELTDMQNSQVIKHVWIAFGLVAGGILFLLCGSCQQQQAPLRGVELYEQMKEVISNPTGQKVEIHARREKIDSLVRASAALSPIEHYTVLFHALEISVSLSEHEQAAHYLQKLDSLPFPQLHDKADGFLLLDCYAGVATIYINREPRIINPERIATLLFDMENRWRFTPQERLRFLEVKSKIYFNIFREYKSAVMIIYDAIRIAPECATDNATVVNLYRALFKYSMWLGQGEEEMRLGDDFAQLAATLQPDASTEKLIYRMTGLLYKQQGNYPKAYDYLNKPGVVDSGIFNNTFIHLCIQLDSLPVALAYIDQHRKKNPNPVVLASIAWNEACVRLKAGDQKGYERCLRESMTLFDGLTSGRLEICAPAEAYARMLWQQSQRPEAIRKLEWVTDGLKNTIIRHDKGKSETFRLNFDEIQVKMLSPFRLLRDYYYYAGRTTDGARLSLLCDSLELRVSNARLQMNQQKWQAAIFTKDLVSNLELRTAEFQQEQQKFYFTCSMLGVALLAGIVFFVLYRQREHQLNVLYGRQKEIEQLQAEKQRLEKAKIEQLSPEELLFRKLEQLFYEEELFRNPGFSRDDLCQLGGSNRMYVSTCINKHAGANINQWINKARINYAIRLIGEGECDLAKLAEQSGFSSIKSFFRNFKQFTSLSPRQYIVRNRQQKE